MAIWRQKPRFKNWYSHKFNEPSVHYKICLCIQTGDIVWVNGPHKPGVMNDIQMFSSKIGSMLQPGEKVEADLGYRGDLSKIRHAGVFVLYADRRAKRRARARHETVNNSFKKSMHYIVNLAMIFTSTRLCLKLLLQSSKSMVNNWFNIVIKKCE